jgi:RimJ/RimL family protein N-acetyltransferase
MAAAGVTLRNVEEGDLPALFEQQLDEDATAMAAVPAREREAFDAHWRRILADETVVVKTISVGGEVAGDVLCWEQDGRRLVGYWLGKAFWGRGIASAALAEFLRQVPVRPLHAIVAEHNPGSIRVLEKSGFACVERRTSDDGVAERVYALSA